MPLNQMTCGRPNCTSGENFSRGSENRINGYCSVECEAFHEYETEIEALRDRCGELEKALKEIAKEPEGPEPPFGIEGTAQWWSETVTRLRLIAAQAVVNGFPTTQARITEPKEEGL